MKVIITESQLRKIVSSIISKENNIYGIKQGMSLINEDGRKLFSLEDIKKRISDATSWENFKEKNPNLYGMQRYININYKNDPYNNWESLMSVFDDAPFKYSLEDIKKTISNATSWEDFKEKNPKWNHMQRYIRKNYENDPYNNWKALMSVFDVIRIRPTKYSLEYIKKKISDATSLDDFKENNPKWGSMYSYIRDNYKNDPYNNWKALMSVFDVIRPTKYSLEYIKKKISDATSWKDFKEKNPYLKSMQHYIKKNYENDPYNNWESLTSHFDDKYVERQYLPNGESKGEKKVKSSLIDLGYDVSTQKRFKGCYGFKGKRYCDLLKFDTYVEKKNGKKVCVEFDGEQHFMSVGIFGGDITLEEQQKRDQLKNDYCKNNSVKLIRIHYLDFNRIEEILENELGPYEEKNMDNNMDMGIFYSRPEEYQHLT